MCHKIINPSATRLSTALEAKTKWSHNIKILRKPFPNWNSIFTQTENQASGHSKKFSDIHNLKNLLPIQSF